MISNNFIKRHNGPREAQVKKMLEKTGAESLDQLINETIPAPIRLEKDLNLPHGYNEREYTNLIKKIGSKNKSFKSFIGMGYYNTITPGVIQRNILENPGWYTSYTPYQAEISQGRLEALLNFQTMIVELTGLPIANSSLLDEATSAAEAMIMAFNARSRKKKKAGANKFFVSDKIFPQSMAVIETRAEPLGIELVVGKPEDITLDGNFFGGLVQYPDADGNIQDLRNFVAQLHEHDALAAVDADLLSLTLLTPPGEWDADIVVGSTQRFGIPLGYGGPHAGFLASKESLKRNIPGRIIGVSVDQQGNSALRMALQTREQHIKRERATSNICTAQALLASMASFYAVYHGPEGLREIARDINIHAGIINKEIEQYGYKQLNDYFFDTLKIQLPEDIKMDAIKKLAMENEINFRYIDDSHLGISIDETTSLEDVNLIMHILAAARNKYFEEYECFPEDCNEIDTLPEGLHRESEFLQQSVFNTYHSETEMMRYMKKLENRDLALNRSMIPLGSCTMKLNGATELFSLSWPEFSDIHPFVPKDQAEGYHELMDDFEQALKEITGYDAISFQPNSGASGEYTGLMTIREYHKNNGEPHRNVSLIPASAHGTNPASSHMAGMKVVEVKTNENGDIDINDLKAKAEKHSDNLAAIMITYPSTHGVFEEGIKEVIDIVHRHGGQVYMDGANMNAQVGYTNPAVIGADVTHLNLHKTFAIPHGGGGPGVGPIGVKEHLEPFLPSNPVIPTGGDNAIKAIAAAPFGSPLILPVSYAYIKLLGKNGLKRATQYAILNANYIKDSLKGHYKILYTGKKNRCGHEFIIDCNEFHHSADVTVIEIAKRLQDYGLHAPTVAFPVPGTLMVEPTESEPLSEMDRLINAMIKIRREIKDIEEGKVDAKNNVVKNAPHTCEMVSMDGWEHPYTRRQAAFPMDCDKADKYWPPVTKIDDGYGDRHLMVTCEPLEDPSVMEKE
ncbi:MAG: aminomethyl-transferring glycine dehydrogenase [Bacteroidales bacterium]|nr:aminomethyl-transferring glycine dehydrogenase [Bacteroidales bacterium]MCF8337567.1 aminomethyl-transferring glycine dehydrogenase [Bacteroidales bacterium]